MVCKERGSVFEVVLCNSLEDNLGCGEESKKHFSSVRLKLGLVMSLFTALNDHYCLFISHQKHGVSRKMSREREKPKRLLD